MLKNYKNWNDKGIYEDIQELKSRFKKFLNLNKNNNEYRNSKFPHIQKICEDLNIKDYYINDDETVDVGSDVDLEKGITGELQILPIKFGSINGDFLFDFKNIVSLSGCPKYVEGNFDCSNNINLRSLEGCPIYIGKAFWCANNDNIKNFDGFPRHAKGVFLNGTPIRNVFNLFSDVYLNDGGDFFSSSGTMMDLFWDLDPIRDGKVIIERRMNSFLSSIGRELTPIKIKKLNIFGWKVV